MSATYERVLYEELLQFAEAYQVPTRIQGPELDGAENTVQHKIHGRSGID